MVKIHQAHKASRRGARLFEYVEALKERLGRHECTRTFQLDEDLARARQVDDPNRISWLRILMTRPLCSGALLATARWCLKKSCWLEKIEGRKNAVQIKTVQTLYTRTLTRIVATAIHALDGEERLWITYKTERLHQRLHSTDQGIPDRQTRGKAP